GMFNFRSGRVKPNPPGKDELIATRQESGTAGLRVFSVPGCTIGKNLVPLASVHGKKGSVGSEILKPTPPPLGSPPAKFKDRKFGKTLRDWLTTAPKA